MISCELAKQLAEAGFRGKRCEYLGADLMCGEQCFPTLSELIEACGTRFTELKRNECNWVVPYNIQVEEFLEDRVFFKGNNPETAVAMFWLELNKK